MLTVPALMEGVERTNVVIVNPNQWTEFMPRQDSYAIDVNCSRNYYSCGGFEHLVRNYRNQEIIGQERMLEYGDNSNNMNSNLNEEESLVVLN